MKERPQCPRVVVIGGGFGGLHAASFIVIMLDAIATTHLSRFFHELVQPAILQGGAK